ncbi:hypothetical protein RCO27_03215 [Sphingosinicella sp. LHD-64]|uniref:hypothetical protein n=1 Tax=Sphingosinicella sp. LHD-64 TaxID=3072139 RepID=UPI00280FB64C|nr:hypothetical protein [Sphingosinicella sp. LHD-64]MDQ8755231.1 hypothetical protein [Sphingosinicella sp. LHD-64]
MSGTEDVARLIRARRDGLCDACIAADLALPTRRVHWAAAMLGKVIGFQRIHHRCSRCTEIRWMTRRAA